MEEVVLLLPETCLVEEVDYTVAQLVAVKINESLILSHYNYPYLKLLGLKSRRCLIVPI